MIFCCVCASFVAQIYPLWIEISYQASSSKKMFTFLGDMDGVITSTALTYFPEYSDDCLGFTQILSLSFNMLPDLFHNSIYNTCLWISSDLIPFPPFKTYQVLLSYIVQSSSKSISIFCLFNTICLWTVVDRKKAFCFFCCKHFQLIFQIIIFSSFKSNTVMFINLST